MGILWGHRQAEVSHPAEPRTAEVITDRYHAHVLGSHGGCVAFTVLEPISRSQRLFQPVVVGIGPPGGQFPWTWAASSMAASASSRRPRSARLVERLFSDLARSGRIAYGWVLVGRRPRSLML